MNRMRWCFAVVFVVAFGALSAIPAGTDEPPAQEKAPPPGNAADKPAVKPADRPAVPLLSLSGSDAQPIVRRFDDGVDVLNEMTDAFRRLATELSSSESPAEFAAEIERFCDAMEKFQDRMEQFRITHPELQNPRNRDAAKEVLPALEEFQKIIKEISSSDAARAVDRKYARFRSDPAVQHAYKRMQEQMKEFGETKPTPQLSGRPHTE
ncbi:MAG: hypothetical protein KA419_14820 [Acidobacteria bacterium]|nr:hypothetical protein [Acidobacteriota bacterium]